MKVPPEKCARELLDVVPTVMRDIRSEMRSRRASGLTVPQFRALMFVSRNKGSSLSELANHMGLTLPSISRLVDGLIARSMITREEHPDDRRRMRLAVTSAGRECFEASRRGTLAYLAEKLDQVTTDDREIITRAMETLRTVFAASGQQGTR
jgi:DNA-binding MarR family transcriptional regulator